MDNKTLNKYRVLVEMLKGFGSCAIAFSGGTDSTLLAYAAKEALLENALLVTIKARSTSKKELDDAIAYAHHIAIMHEIINADELSIEGYKNNTKDRCYICKKHLMGLIKEFAKSKGILCVAEGSNVDDLGDFRPGKRAVEELLIKSPLLEAGLNKAEIRALSLHFNLPSHNKAAFACLASRIPTGTQITEEKLRAVEIAEEALYKMGFSQFRVRHHGDVARIEILKEEMPLIFQDDNRERMDASIVEAGFKFATLDLGGYKMGSMN